MYSSTSPWKDTNFNVGDYLGLYNHRSIPAEADDLIYEIQSQYNYRPDLLAFDLYGTSKLWWVFANRNMDVLKDPVFDFKSGVKIYLPKKSLLLSIIGL